MPRGVGLNWMYDEARLQGRLWTPDLLHPELYIDALADNVLDSSGFVTIPNLGSLGSSFSRGEITPTKQFIFPQNGLPCFYKDNGNAFGYPLGIPYSLQPASGFSAYFFGATAAGSYMQNLCQYNLANSILLAANNTNAFAISLYDDGGWRARSLSTQTSLDNRRVIMSQRKASFSSSSFIDTYLSDYRSATVRESIGCGSFLAPATTVGFLGHVNFQAGTFCKCFAVLHFQRMLSDYEDDLILGWGAWKFGYQDLLFASHPFVNRPPLIGD